MSLDAKAAAKLLRKQLRAELELGPRKVSVRVSGCGGWSERIHVRIKAPGIDRAKVEAIAKRHEVIRRDSHGNILSGLNLWVEVAVDELAVVHHVDAALEKLQGMAVGAGDRVLGRDVVRHEGGRFSIDGGPAWRAAPESVARHLATFAA